MLRRTTEYKVKTYLGNNAAESGLKNVGPVNLLHIATHGFFEQDHSDRMQMYRDRQ